MVVQTIFNAKDALAIEKYKSLLDPGKKPWTYILTEQDKKIGCIETIDYLIPDEIYGDIDVKAQRVITRYANRDGNLGVVLAGEKGTGKTLLSHLISHKARVELGIPTFIIDKGLVGPEFNTFFRQLPASVVLIDEFEKKYQYTQQDQLLTLLSGMQHDHKKIIVATLNNKHMVNNYIKGRPERIHYWFEFYGLGKEIDFVKDYCKAKLSPIYVGQGYIDSIVRLCHMYPRMNFDSLKGLVDEINLTGEHPRDAIKFLNIETNDTDGTGNVQYDIKVVLQQTQQLVQCHPATLDSPPHSYIKTEETRYMRNRQGGDLVFVLTVDPADPQSRDTVTFNITGDSLKLQDDGTYTWTSPGNKYLFTFTKNETSAHGGVDLV